MRCRPVFPPRALVFALALTAASVLGQQDAAAYCRDHLPSLKVRIDAIRSSNPPRYTLAIKWWSAASAAEPTSEVQCVNDYHLAVKALQDPLQEVANCVGPNQSLPRCRTAAQVPVGGTPAGGALPGGGGGGGGPAFTPPGSVGSKPDPVAGGCRGCGGK
jgi:hypothetical protein